MSTQIKLFILILLTPFLTQAANHDRIDTVVIHNTSFVRTFKDNQFYCLTNFKQDTIFKTQSHFFRVKFTDFNKDGFLDIYADIFSNAPGDCEIYLFDKDKDSFRELKNTFPNSKNIAGTIYFYSYNRAGCADNDWESHLFFIDNFETVRIGFINAKGCGDKNDGIFIYKTQGDTESLLKSMPIQTINKYKELKLGFIEDYWTKNYFQFRK